MAVSTTVCDYERPVESSSCKTDVHGTALTYQNAFTLPQNALLSLSLAVSLADLENTFVIGATVDFLMIIQDPTLIHTFLTFEGRANCAVENFSDCIAERHKQKCVVQCSLYAQQQYWQYCCVCRASIQSSITLHWLQKHQNNASLYLFSTTDCISRVRFVNAHRNISRLYSFFIHHPLAILCTDSCLLFRQYGSHVHNPAVPRYNFQTTLMNCYEQSLIRKSRNNSSRALVVI